MRKSDRKQFVVNSSWQAGQVASHIAKTACWAHPNPYKMRKCSFAAARSSCAYSLRKEA